MKPMVPAAPPRWRRYGFCAFAAVGIVTLIVVLVTVLMPAPAVTRPVGSATAITTSPNGWGLLKCASQPSVFSAPLRWGSDPATADRICCQQHHYAEFAGYWERTSFPRQLPAGESRITFYDVTTHRPLYTAPVGRSWDEFYEESHHHGWPSFRDEEVVHENVFVADDGEILSVNGTHLGNGTDLPTHLRFSLRLLPTAAPHGCYFYLLRRPQPAGLQGQSPLYQYRVRGWTRVMKMGMAWTCAAARVD